jgi:hypothetical protein
MQTTCQKTYPAYRTQHRFWLDTNRQDERDLAEYIAALKEKRTFVSTLRDALRLIRDLRQGRVEVLLKLFPWVADYFMAQTHYLPATSPIPDLHLALQTHLERVEKLLSSRPVMETPMLPPTVPSRYAGDEIDLEIKVAEEDEEAGKRATQNFMRSLMAIQNLPSNPPPGKSPMSRRTEGPQKLEVPILDAPIFEDSDLDHLLD